MKITDNPQLSELRGLIAGYAPSDGCYRTAINSLSLIRRSQSLAPLVVRLPHVLCIAAQGQREVLVGEEVYSCGPDQYIVSAFDIPGSAAIIGATADQPYLGLEWEFDPARIRPLIEEGHVAVPVGGASDRGIYVEPVTPTLLDGAVRLVRLLQHPEEIPVLAPMIEREILFRLLSGRNGAVLHYMTKTGSQSQRIAVAITWLRRNYRQQMRIDQLARHVGMSASSFHHWFRSITGMSPLQYQKQLRLQEARNILRNEGLDVGSVSRRVGYESSSQFSREYSRLFGAPPVREINKAGSAF